MKILLNLTKQEAAETEVMDGQEYDSELTKLADSATEKGVNEISKGEKNLDSEFSDEPKRAVVKHRASKKKSKKKKNKRKK